MYARVTYSQLKPGTTEEGTRSLNESVKPALMKQKRFKAGYLFSDSNSGKGIAISIWESEADLRANETSGYYQEQIAKIGALLAGPPTREQYEVTGWA